MSDRKRHTVCVISKEHKKALHLGESEVSTPDSDENGLAQVPLESFLPRSLSQLEAERNGLKLPESTSSSPTASGRKQKLHVVSVVTHPDGYFPALCLSAKLLDIDIKILGWGEKWGGFRWKLLKVLDFIKTLPEDDVVLVIDGFDTLMTQPAHIILERFIAMKQEFVCTGEKAPFFLWQVFHNAMFKDPEDPDWPSTPVPQSRGTGLLDRAYNWYQKQTATPWMLNAGSWIAYAGVARKVLGACPPSEPNDQRFLTGLYVRDLMGVKVDVDCHLFHLYRGKRSYRMVRWDDKTSPLGKLTDGKYRFVPWPEENDPNVRVDAKAAKDKEKEGGDKKFVMSKTLLCGTLVDVDSGTAPCLLHVHCRRNIDSAVQELRLPPMMARTWAATIWYLYYSIKGLAHVPRYMYLLVFCTILVLSILSSVVYGLYSIFPTNLTSRGVSRCPPCPVVPAPQPKCSAGLIDGTSMDALRPELNLDFGSLDKPVELCLTEKKGRSCYHLPAGKFSSLDFGKFSGANVELNVPDAGASVEAWDLPGFEGKRYGPFTAADGPVKLQNAKGWRSMKVKKAKKSS